MKRHRIRRRLLQPRKFLLLRCQFRLCIRQRSPRILHALILRFDCPRIADFANQPALFLDFIRLCRAFLQCLFRILQFLKTLHQRFCGLNLLHGFVAIFLRCPLLLRQFALLQLQACTHAGQHFRQRIHLFGLQFFCSDNRAFRRFQRLRIFLRQPFRHRSPRKKGHIRPLGLRRGVLLLRQRLQAFAQLIIVVRFQQIAQQFRLFLAARAQEVHKFALRNHHHFAELVCRQAHNLFDFAVRVRQLARILRAVRHQQLRRFALFLLLCTCSLGGADVPRRARNLVRFLLPMLMRRKDKRHKRLVIPHVHKLAQQLVFLAAAVCAHFAVEREHHCIENGGFARPRVAADEEKIAALLEVNLRFFAVRAKGLHRQKNRFHAFSSFMAFMTSVSSAFSSAFSRSPANCRHSS